MISNYNLNRVVAHKYLEKMSEYVYEENPLMYSIVILNPIYVRTFFYLLYGSPSRYKIDYNGKFLVIIMINGKVINCKSNITTWKYTHGWRDPDEKYDTLFEGLFLNRPKLEEYFEENWPYYEDRRKTTI